jgi:hypothetical protein
LLHLPTQVNDSQGFDGHSASIVLVKLLIILCRHALLFGMSYPLLFRFEIIEQFIDSEIDTAYSAKFPLTRNNG